MVKAIPDGYHTLTPSFTFKDSQKAIDFYKRAFNAKVLDQFPNLNGKGIMHAVLEIGDSRFMMGDEMHGPMSPRSAEAMGGSPISLFVYVPNVDEAFKQAIAAGAKEQMAVMDMFWGDRAGSLRDPFGYSWMIATHKQDLKPEQIRKNAEAFFAQMSQK